MKIMTYIGNICRELKGAGKLSTKYEQFYKNCFTGTPNQVEMKLAS